MCRVVWGEVVSGGVVWGVVWGGMQWIEVR